jgi:hypothetical protein
MKAVDDAKIKDKTLFLFATDNGAAQFSRKTKGGKTHISSGPYRGRKRDNWEGGHRVPFIARWPGLVEPNTFSSTVLCLTDFTRTLVAVAGGEVARHDVAEALVQSDRLKLLSNGHLMRSIQEDKHGNLTGLIPASEQLSGSEKERLATILYNSFRPALVTRCSTLDKGATERALEQIVQLARLKNKNIGWQPIGGPEHAKRLWRFRSFNPEKEGLSSTDLKSVTLLPGLKGWFNPEFDDSQWQSGTASIGKGFFKAYGRHPGKSYQTNNSNWGEGEVLATRTETTIGEAELGHDTYRVRILSPHECFVYLNGRGLGGFRGAQQPQYRSFTITPKLFRKGKNTLAVYARTTHYKGKTFCRMNIHFEGLSKEDIGLD